MRRILDLHLHSRYSRACSPRLTLVNIAQTAQTKGVDIIATGDFTHPAWFEAISKELEEIGNTGLYHLKDGSSKTLFLLSTEVSLVYKDGGKVRRLHLVVHAPNLEAVKELKEKLGASYNIRSDGRPILGISAPDFVKLCLHIHPQFLVYPAHIWTPWYAVFGSKSGFDSLEECFHEQTEFIYAYETGLSSDPEMNWRLSALDKLTCLSNSDAHSLENIGREANVMELTSASYENIYQIIKGKKRLVAGDVEGMIETIEFYPEEGMYHLDGHRDCHFSCNPEESRRLHNLCPHCGRPLIIGVSSRVAELADRPLGFKPDKAVPFRRLVELDKIIAESLQVKNRKSIKVNIVYQELIKKFYSELSILMDLDLTILKSDYPVVAAGIERVRQGQLTIIPGFDGQYGLIQVFPDNFFKLKTLF
ncbi:MAG TPA: endonuclease Q family protein [bacterium]|mgnify:FL=1|jgi:uncharacterized protein (TIGR00375 family)|nr:endonuclease Q family protein [bacterium]HQL34765.1 endonuclease Q family protein [bacterium]